MRCRTAGWSARPENLRETRRALAGPERAPYLSLACISESRYDTHMWRLASGFGAAQATAFPPDAAFYGYPALPEAVPAWVRTLPYVHARAPTAAGAGDEVAVRIALDPPAAVLSLEAGRALLPAGKTVAVRVDTAPLAGLTGPLRLDVTGLPAGVHAEFSPPQLAAGETAMLTLIAPCTRNPCGLMMTITSGVRASSFFPNAYMDSRVIFTIFRSVIVSGIRSPACGAIQA